MPVLPSLAESSLPFCATLVDGPVVAPGRMPAPNRRSGAGTGSTGTNLVDLVSPRPASNILDESSLGLPSLVVGGVLGSLPCAGGSSVIESPKSFASASLWKCESAVGSRVVVVSDAKTPVDCVEAAGLGPAFMSLSWVGAGASCFVPASLPMPDVSVVLYEFIPVIARNCTFCCSWVRDRRIGSYSTCKVL